MEMKTKVSRTDDRLRALLLALAIGLTAGCATNQPNVAGVQPRDIDSGIRGPVAGVGIEGHDIVAMTDQMMRDMLQVPTLAGAQRAPRIIVDAEYFTNDSLQAINKNTITDRLRVGLNRASQGRMVFVGRNYAGMVNTERDLKRQGVTDVGSTGMTRAQAGGDYRLGGRISSLDSRNAKTGMMQRYNQVVFEMVDLETGVIAWSGIYEFSRVGADDIVYR
jgi:PBP1b-binding outer membrane lipoprotein LpoB